MWWKFPSHRWRSLALVSDVEIFSFILAWTNCWTNIVGGDSRRHDPLCDVILNCTNYLTLWPPLRRKKTLTTTKVRFRYSACGISCKIFVVKNANRRAFLICLRTPRICGLKSVNITAWHFTCEAKWASLRFRSLAGLSIVCSPVCSG